MARRIMVERRDWTRIELSPEEFLLAAQVCAEYARDESPDGPRDPRPVHSLAAKFFRHAFWLIGDGDLAVRMDEEMVHAGEVAGE